jgi:hypothetical protein
MTRIQWVTSTGRNNSKCGNGHDMDTRPGQTLKKPKDLSTREGEERGSGGSEGVYTVCKCERVE